MEDGDSANLQKLKANGWEIPVTDEDEYDATNPTTRDFFWKCLVGPLPTQGWDAFWLDASEPDTEPHEGDVMLLVKKPS